MNSVFNDPRARQQFAASDAANRRVLVGPIDPAVIVLRTVDGVPLVPAGFVHALIVERSTTRRRVANPEVLVFIEQGDAMEVQAPMCSFRRGASVTVRTYSFRAAVVMFVAIVVVHGCREDFGAAFASPQPNAKTTVHFVWGANGHE